MVMTITFFQSIGNAKKAGIIVMLRQLFLFVPAMIILPMKLSSIGAYSYVANNTDVESADVGKFCSIADHCRIGMGGHTLGMLSTSPIFTEALNGTKTQWVPKDVHAAEDKRVIIGSDVWVGSHVLINGGVKVGHGSVIGAGAVVVKDVPPYAIVGGVPAKVIRYRFSPQIIQRLLEFEWWNMDEEMLKKNISFFQRDNISLDEVNAFVSNVVTKSSVR